MERLQRTCHGRDYGIRIRGSRDWKIRTDGQEEAVKHDPQPVST